MIKIRMNERVEYKQQSEYNDYISGGAGGVDSDSNIIEKKDSRKTSRPQWSISMTIYELSYDVHCQS